MSEKSVPERLATIENDISNIKSDITDIKQTERRHQDEIKRMLNPWPEKVIRLEEWREEMEKQDKKLERRHTRNLVAAVTISPTLFAVFQYILKIVFKK